MIMYFEAVKSANPLEQIQDRNWQRTAATDVVPLTYCFFQFVDKVLLERVKQLEKSVKPNVPRFPSAAQRLFPVILSWATLLPSSHTFHGPRHTKHTNTTPRSDWFRSAAKPDMVLVMKLCEGECKHSLWHDLSAVYHLDSGWQRSAAAHNIVRDTRCPECQDEQVWRFCPSTGSNSMDEERTRLVLKVIELWKYLGIFFYTSYFQSTLFLSLSGH